MLDLLSKCVFVKNWTKFYVKIYLKVRFSKFYVNWKSFQKIEYPFEKSQIEQQQWVHIAARWWDHTKFSAGLSEPGVAPQLLADQLTLFQPEGNLCPRHYWPHRILRPSYGPEFIAAFFSTRRSYFILGSRQYAGSVLTLRRFEYDYGGQKAICQFCRCAGSISDQAELKTRDSYF